MQTTGFEIFENISTQAKQSQRVYLTLKNVIHDGEQILRRKA